MTEADLEGLVGLDRVRDEVQRILALRWEEERGLGQGPWQESSYQILDEVTIDLLLG